MFTLMTPSLAAEYYRWLADKYGITFKEAIEHDDKCGSKDWPEWAAQRKDD